MSSKKLNLDKFDKTVLLEMHEETSKDYKSLSLPSSSVGYYRRIIAGFASSGLKE